MQQRLKQIAALFDLDGVLIDTEGTYSKFWAEMGKSHNLPYADFADRIKGTTLVNILNTYFPADEHPHIIEKLEEYEHNMRYEMFPGVEEFLIALHNHDIPAAVVTSSGEKKMNRLWQQIPQMRGYFRTVITDAQVTRSKPDPQGYLLAAQTLGRNAADCYVFEDSFNGLLAGRRAGAKVIALSTTNPAQALRDKADMVMSDFIGFTIEHMLSI